MNYNSNNSNNNNNNTHEVLWKKILKAETDSTCRLCQKFDETVHHIISVCPILAKEQYIKRHDRVGA